MRRIILFFSILATAAAADGDFARTPEATPYRGHGVLSRFVRNYLPEYEPPVSFANSNRMDALMRAGNIYLSLQDAIAIGNNENPLVVASLYREQAAKYLVDQIRGELLHTERL